MALYLHTAVLRTPYAAGLERTHARKQQVSAQGWVHANV